MSARILQSLWRNGDGSALIEGAVLMPVLLILVLGVFEFSWLIDQQHLISTGINDAARYIARSANPHDRNDPGGRKETSDHGRDRRHDRSGQGLDDARCQYYVRLCS